MDGVTVTTTASALAISSVGRITAPSSITWQFHTMTAVQPMIIAWQSMTIMRPPTAALLQSLVNMDGVTVTATASALAISSVGRITASPSIPWQFQPMTAVQPKLIWAEAEMMLVPK